MIRTLGKLCLAAIGRDNKEDKSNNSGRIDAKEGKMWTGETIPLP
jgi:hypothetical protein